MLRRRLGAYPAVALLGPRQSGKTTLARSLGGRYFDLQQEPDQLRVDLEWDGLIVGRELVVLDEVQVWPDLFPRLRGAIDQDRKRNGRFLLLGSVSPALMTQVSESLAGRLSLMALTPFTTSELSDPADHGRHWLMGGFADGGVLTGRGFPEWQIDYLDMLVYRDLPNWGMRVGAASMGRLIRMLALAHGREWNASQVGKSMGLSNHTVNRYVDCLEGAFLVRRLPAYHANLRKRLVKRPKLYWRDSGLLHALQRVTDKDALLHQPWVGASWEGYVIEQVLAAFQHAGVAFRASYLRTSDQRELDLVVEVGTELWAIETKLTSRPGRGGLRKLDANADLIGADRRFLIGHQCDRVDGGSRVVCDLEGMLDRIGTDLPGGDQACRSPETSDGRGGGKPAVGRRPIGVSPTAADAG